MAALIILSYGCKPKPHEISQTQSLENFAAGKRIKDNVCMGTSEDRQSKTVQAILNRGVGESFEDHRDEVEKAVSAVPERVRRSFLNRGGTIRITKDMDTACGVLAGTLTDVHVPGSIDACYTLNAEKDAESEVEIAIYASPQSIRHNLVQQFGYVFSQFLTTTLSESDDEFTEAELKRIAEHKATVESAFFEDMTLSPLFDIAAIDDLLGGKSAQVKKNIKQGKPALAGLEGATQKRVKDFIFAEAFDSYYCNAVAKVTKKQLKAITPAGGGSLTDLTNNLEGIDNSRVVMGLLFATSFQKFRKFHKSVIRPGQGGLSLTQDFCSTGFLGGPTDPFISPAQSSADLFGMNTPKLASAQQNTGLFTQTLQDPATGAATDFSSSFASFTPWTGGSTMTGNANDGAMAGNDQSSSWFGSSTPVASQKPAATNPAAGWNRQINAVAEASPAAFNTQSIYSSPSTASAGSPATTSTAATGPATTTEAGTSFFGLSNLGKAVRNCAGSASTASGTRKAPGGGTPSTGRRSALGAADGGALRRLEQADEAFRRAEWGKIARSPTVFQKYKTEEFTSWVKRNPSTSEKVDLKDHFVSQWSELDELGRKGKELSRTARNPEQALQARQMMNEAAIKRTALHQAALDAKWDDQFLSGISDALGYRSNRPGLDLWRTRFPQSGN